MLVQVMMLIVVLAAFGMVSVHESIVAVQLARSQITASQLRDVAAGAVEDARLIVAARVSNPQSVVNGRTPAPLTTTLPLCGVASNGCTIGVSESFTLAIDGALTYAGLATPAPCTTNNATFADVAEVCNTEIGGALREGRATVTVEVILHDKNGAELATTTRIVRLRTFAAAPYALVVGVRDPSSTSGAQIVADSGGVAPPAQPTAAATIAPTPFVSFRPLFIGGAGGGGAIWVKIEITPTPAPEADDTPSLANASPGISQDTLIRNYAPCVFDPKRPGTSAIYDNWQGNMNHHIVTATCRLNAGDTSVFANGMIPVARPTDGWSM